MSFCENIQSLFTKLFSNIHKENGVCEPLSYTHKQVFVKINFMRESQKVKASFVYLKSNDVSNRKTAT
jgi:hypothetical protein